MKVIKDRSIVEDAWHLLGDDEPFPPEGHALVSVARWNAEREALLATGAPVGVVLRSNQTPEDIAERDRLAMIAIDFPAFTDGRGYPSARSLLCRCGYMGELRAIGDVLRDQLFFMKRCGIDSFAMKAGKDIEGALEAFYDFSVTYQAAADDERPLWRRVDR